MKKENLDKEFAALDREELVKLIELTREERKISAELIFKEVDALIDIIKFLLSIFIPTLITLYTVKFPVDLSQLKIILTYIVPLLIFGLIMLFKSRSKKLVPLINSSNVNLDLLTELSKNWLLKQQTADLKRQKEDLEKRVRKQRNR